MYNGISIPLHWIHLDNKGGNSNSKQRIDLMKWFINNCPNIAIDYLLADREFPSEEFIRWLCDNKIPFIFRSKSSILVTNGNKRVRISKLFPNLSNYPNKTKADSRIRRIYNNRLYLTMRENHANERVYFISNSNQDNSAGIYRKRWTIEAMFAKFKTKGLKLESTHLMKSSRVVNLFMFMAIAYCYSCKIGEIINTLKPTKLKQLKNDNNSMRTTKEFSLFNRGADLLKILVDNHLSYKAVIFKQLSRILSSPPNTCIDKRLAIVRIIMIR